MSASSALVGVVNAGSSSLKISYYEDERRVLSCQVDGIGVRPAMKATNAADEAVAGLDFTHTQPRTPSEALILVMPWLREQTGGRPVGALGHRVVHGGPRYAGPERVTPALLDEMVKFEPLAPLHQPYNLAPIRTALERAPSLPQVACFDTAFHHSMPAVAHTFAIPQDLTALGVRRYGFHGLSYEYIASRLPDLAPEIAGGRVVVAHLGNGASLCAIRAGRSVATSMGFSALDGLPMGTRCGELDPAVVLHLLQERGMTPAEVEDLLYRRSGMLGLSGISSDFRDLLESKEPSARFAIDLFVYRVARGIGSLAAALGGLDGIVFTAGVGENAKPIRAAICEACTWLGVDFDAEANETRRQCITRAGSRVAAHVIPTDENLMIARHTRAAIIS